MPICVQCDGYFPNKLVIDGKQRVLNSRKRCLTCSPFGTHNTKPVISSSNNKKEKICVKCNRVHNIKGKYCNTCKTTIRRVKLKQRSIDYKGGKCQRCGYDKSYAALTFHHIKPETKKFTISGNYCRSWESIKKELDKCELLCMNCHAEVEHEKRQYMYDNVPPQTRVC